VGGIFYEHTHRLIASLVGFMTIGLAVWLWLVERRNWLRWLGCLAVFLVILQGVLGGLRVTALKDEIGIFHAVLGQLFFVLVSLIALFTSRWWPRALARSAAATAATTGRGRRSAASATMTPEENFVIYDRKGLRYLYAIASGMILLQLILGATMRHQHAGLAIPDFPTAYGALWPAMDSEAVAHYNQMRGEVAALNPITALGVGLQMAHRLVALMVLIGVAAAAWLTRRQWGGRSLLAKLSLIWFAWIALQACLGAATIWTNKSADIATAHVAVGAVSLMTGAFVVLTAARCLKKATEASVGVPEITLSAPLRDRHLPA
jgi:cytochrome c oxidase assembly protein subunit 15